jgi:hypothetical protein
VVDGIVEVADHEAEVERHGEDDEKTEDDFFEIHFMPRLVKLHES